MKFNETKDGRKAILGLGGTGKDHGGILLTRITTKTYPGNLDKAVIRTLFIRGMIHTNSIVLLQLDRSQLTVSTVTDGECKYYT